MLLNKSNVADMFTDKCNAVPVEVVVVRVWRKGRDTWRCMRHVTYLLTYLLHGAVVQDIILKADCHSAYQKISCFLM
jgi:hypothetical protein